MATRPIWPAVLVLLVACATHDEPRVVRVPQIVRIPAPVCVALPEEVVAPVDVPALPPDPVTYRALAEWAGELRSLIERLQADREVARQASSACRGRDGEAR